MNKVVRAGFTMVVFALLAVVFITPAQVRRDKKTKVTFGHNVEIPGRVLPAGTYYFKLFDSTASRNIVEVWNEDETQRLALILAIANERFRPTDNPVVEYGETPAGSPPAMKEWFYAGQKEGLEFVYPKREAVQIAQAAKEIVPAEEIELTESNLTTVPIIAVTPEGTEESLAKAVEASPVEPTEVAQTLPRTGSPIPLIAIIGACFVAIGFVLRKLAHQKS